MTIYYRIISRVLHCPSAGTNPMTAFHGVNLCRVWAFSFHGDGTIYSIPHLQRI